MKSLVVYFSRTGENSVNGKIEIIEKGYTEIIAQKIAKKLDAHIFKLEPVEPYPYNYAECVKRASNEGFVSYLHEDFKIDEYDTIFLGFPNWWRSYPRIVATFIKNNNWFGKTVIPFCTNEEGAFGIGESELKASIKGAAIKEGFAIRGYDAINADEKLDNWLARVL